MRLFASSEGLREQLVARSFGAHVRLFKLPLVRAGLRGEVIKHRSEVFEVVDIRRLHVFVFDVLEVWLELPLNVKHLFLHFLLFNDVQLLF